MSSTPPYTSVPFAAPLVERMNALKAELARRGADRDASAARDEEVMLHAEELQVAEEELRQSLEALDEAARRAEREAMRFRRVFDLSPDPLFVTDPGGALVDANVAAGDLVEQPQTGWTGVPLATYLHADDVRTFQEALAGAEKGPCRVRLRFRGCNGRSMRGSVRASLTRELNQVLWTVRLERGGRTEGTTPPPSGAELEKRLNQRIQELEQEIAVRERRLHAERHVREDAQAQAATQQRVMAIVAHEATNVTRCISSWAQPLAAVASGAHAEGLRAIAWAAEIELQVLRDLVDVARLATQQLRAEFVPVDVVDVARRAVAALAPRAEIARVELGGRFAESMPVQGEATRLSQLVLDVIAMSIGLAGPGGHVAVCGDTGPSELQIVVSRSGRDLRREELDWNLDRIETDATFAITGKGAGMSLYIARQLVELHGGRLVTESATGETGPTVRLILPRARGGSIPPPPRSSR
jgi:signal transduction histidine kinase